MKRSWISIVLTSLVLSAPAYSWNLNDPVAGENTLHWEALSPEISVCFIEDRDDGAVCFVIERDDCHEPVFLSLAEPYDRDDLEDFLALCEKSLDVADHEGGIKRAGLITAGRSSQDEVRAWLKAVASRRSETGGRIAFPILGHAPVQIVKQDDEQSDRLIIAYNFRLPAPNTYRDMRKIWVMDLIQQMTLNRLSKEGLLPSRAYDAGSFPLPAAALRLKFPLEGGEWSKCLQVCLQRVREIGEIGFTADELQSAKRERLQNIQEILKRRGVFSIAAFHAQGFAQGMKAFDFETFLDSAANLIESVTPIDIAIVMHECFLPEQRTVGYLTSQAVDESWLAVAEQVINSVEKGEAQKIAYLKTEMEAPNLLEQLPLDDHDRSLIYKIVDTMAHDNVIKLGWKRKTMEKKGKKIRHVHPLRFLSYVFGDHHLHQCMREISRSSFKWNGFIDGMRSRIDEEAAKGGLLPFAHDFAKHLNVDEGRIRHYIEKRDWEGLVRHLL